MERITVAEASAITGLSTQSIYNYINDGVLTSYKKETSTWKKRWTYLLKEEVEDFYEARKTASFSKWNAIELAQTKNDAKDIIKQNLHLTEQINWLKTINEILQKNITKLEKDNNEIQEKYETAKDEQMNTIKELYEVKGENSVLEYKIQSKELQIQEWTAKLIEQNNQNQTLIRKTRIFAIIIVVFSLIIALLTLFLTYKIFFVK